MKVKISDIIIPDARARSRWTDEQKALLKSSIGEHGQLSDPLVRPLPDGKYELVDGESRIYEFTSAGMDECEVKIVEMTDKGAHMANIQMNIARGLQDPMGESLAFHQALDAGSTIEEITTATGQSEDWVKLRLALADLPEDYQKALEEGYLKLGHIQHALRLPDTKEITMILDTILKVGLTVVATKNYVTNRLGEHRAAQALKEQYGIEAPTLQPNPQRTMKTQMCLAHNGPVDSDAITLPRICTECWTFLKYAVSQVGTGEQAMQQIFDALRLQEATKKRAEDIILRERAAPVIPQPEIVPTLQPKPTPEFEEAFVKPADMSAEDWGKLKQQLKAAYSG